MHLKKLGRYELVRVLGKGAMGVVYEGRDPNLDRRVALKTIMVDGLSGQEAAEYETRFRTEARSAARLQHPNIVSVYDSDRDGDTAFLVMEYIQGEDLKQNLDRGERQTLGEALRLLDDLLSALDFAHRQGIVHRDIKPANLLVEAGGRLKLTDFGVARIAGEATRTQGSMIGTLKYMAPEQVQGQQVDARADLFSAGVVAYQLLTGARPFDGDNDFSIIQQVIGHTPPPPSTLAPQLPAAVDAVLARALAKNRDERFQSAEAFSQALREAFGGVDAGALATVLPPRAAVAAAAPTMPLSLPAATVPTAPITQELELEYWRDVRDATDPRELEGFLARFPEGIYADLARRRLQRLASTGDDPERTVLHGMTQVPSAAPPQDKARSEKEPTSPVDRPTSGQAAAVASADPHPVAPLPAAANGTPAPHSRPRRGVLWVGAGAAAAGFIFAVALMAGRDGGPGQAEARAPQAPAAAAPLPAHAASTPSAAAVAADPSAPAAKARPAAAAQRPAPSHAAPRRRTPDQAASSQAAEPAPQPNQAADEEKPESTVASQQGTRLQGQRLVPPAETCRDKVFVLKQFCLQSECAKPGYQNFPACIKLKELARLREESKVRN